MPFEPVRRKHTMYQGELNLFNFRRMAFAEWLEENGFTALPKLNKYEKIHYHDNERGYAILFKLVVTEHSADYKTLFIGGQTEMHYRRFLGEYYLAKAQREFFDYGLDDAGMRFLHQKKVVVAGDQYTVKPSSKAQYNPNLEVRSLTTAQRLDLIRWAGIPKSLPPRRREVVECRLRHKSNAAAGRELGITGNTVSIALHATSHLCIPALRQAILESERRTEDHA